MKNINKTTCNQRYQYQHDKNIRKIYLIQGNTQRHLLGYPNQMYSILKVISTGILKEWRIKVMQLLMMVKKAV